MALFSFRAQFDCIFEWRARLFEVAYFLASSKKLYNIAKSGLVIRLKIHGLNPSRRNFSFILRELKARLEGRRKNFSSGSRIW